jgi:hypothetical protein
VRGGGAVTFKIVISELWSSGKTILFFCGLSLLSLVEGFVCLYQGRIDDFHRDLIWAAFFVVIAQLEIIKKRLDE